MIASRVQRRVMLRLMPFLIAAYLLAYIDRANVGVAKLQMQGELKFSDEIIGFGAGIFFFGYFLLEIPGSLIVERWSARKWFARIMVSWGAVSALTGLVGLPVFDAISTRHQFFIARFLLGATEAGFFPGVIVYLSHWFRHEDRARAKAWFMVTQPLSVIVGTPLARWILETVRWHALSSWRWVFILEGVPAIFLGIIAWFYLTDRVEDARWLPADEKSWLLAELRTETQARVEAHRVDLLAAFRLPQTLLLTMVLFLIVTGNQAILFFLPTIIDNMKNYSVTWRTFVTILPYICSVFGILFNGYSSNRAREYRWHTALPILMTGVSLCLAVYSGNHLGFAVAFFCLAGFTQQAYLPPFWSIPTALLGKSAAAAAIGAINSFGNLGGFLGPSLFGYLKTTTGNYQTGLWFLAGCMLLSGALATQIRIESHEKKT